MRRSAQLVDFKTLGNVVAAQRAVGADDVGQTAVFVVGHGLEQRLADLHGLLVVRQLHTEGAGMARAALVRVHTGAGHHLEHFLGFLADVLHPAMTRNLVADLAQRHRKLHLQKAVALAGHEVFKRVPHVRFDELHISIVGVHERDFLLEHQGAAGHGAEDGIAFFGVAGQHRNIGLFAFVDGLQVTELELGHAAALLFIDQQVRHFVVVQHLEQVVADAGLVVIDIAGGIDHHLAGRLGTVAHRVRRRLGRAGAELLRGELRQPGVFVHAQYFFHQGAGGLGFVDSIDRLHHDGNAGELAVRVGRSQEFFSRTHFTFFELDGLGLQHGVRKVEVELVRRHVRALGQVAQVAHEALVHHFPVVFFVHAIDFTGLAFVDQVKQRGKRAAQAHAAAAAVANVKNALHFMEHFVFVVVVGVFPVDRVARRRLQVAFCGHGLAS